MKSPSDSDEYRDALVHFTAAQKNLMNAMLHYNKEAKDDIHLPNFHKGNDTRH